MPKRKPANRNLRRHERRNDSYDRRPGSRPGGRCILIVCEGAETEPNYFKSLRDFLKLSIIQVQIQGRASAPITVINEALKQVEKREQEIERNPNLKRFEAVWCVFDVENPHHNSTFDQAVQIAKQNKFQLAVSNPAFEFWYILHFEYTTRPFVDGDELKRYLKQNHISGYDPAKSVFDELMDTIRVAIQNSKSILKNHPQGEQPFPNPSTQVHLLVEEMVEMSPSGREYLKDSLSFR